MNRRGGGFPGGGGMGNMQQLMQQARQMQAKMEAMQAELALKTVEASAGGGAVKAVVNGKYELLSLEIAKEALEGADAEMVADMVKGAVNEAMKKSKEMQDQAMGGALGGMGVPPGLF
jgi:DNA-binding YbaB/EbfC family protein